ncbi:HemK family protein methyltransferase [Nocardioides montaniterrae]
MPELVSRLRAAGCVFAEDEAAVLLASAGSDEELEAMVVRRVAGAPLEHVVGWVDFAGVRVGIDPGVFIPRQRTALMVERVLACMHARGHAAVLACMQASGDAAVLACMQARTVVVDLGCGTGALGLAVAHAVRRAATTEVGVAVEVEVHAVDVDAAAVACARRNLAAAGIAGTVHQGDLTAPLSHHLRGKVDLILANMPYVPTRARDLMPAESRDHEPAHTTDGGTDGLDLIRRVAEQAPRWLTSTGSVWVEVGEDQVAAATYAFESNGLTPRTHTDDDRGATVLSGTMSGISPV